MGRIVPVGLALLILFAGCARDRMTAPETATLTSWIVAGGGSIEALPNGGGYRLTEGSGSKGVTLLSPESYGDNVILSFQAMPEKREGVCVVLLSVADTTGTLHIPASHDGTMSFWTEGVVRNYMIAFHTAFHQPNMFINRNPGMLELARTPDPAGAETWYDLEIGKRGSRLWATVNGAVVLEATDPQGDGLPGGRVGIRLRGPGDGSFSCLLKDVTIRTE